MVEDEGAYNAAHRFWHNGYIPLGTTRPVLTMLPEKMIRYNYVCEICLLLRQP
jgi:hypothetical protein